MKASIKPAGWLREYLQTQMNGLTGHIGEAGFPYDCKFWGATELPTHKKIAWWPFEQTGYHIDGFVRTAILLGDAALLKQAEDMIYPVLQQADADGYIGPAFLKDIQDNDTRWAHVVFFRACLALYEANGDESIPAALVKHYLGYPVDYHQVRNVLNVEIMAELYRITGNRQLLDMAVQAYEDGFGEEEAQLASCVGKAHIHGVTFHEYAKLGAILYRHTGNKNYLNRSIRAYEKIRRHYLLPGGCSSSSEYLWKNTYDETYETCDSADMTWSLSYLASVCDDASYSDMAETCIFNAGTGCVTEDFKALQYFSCANQLVLDEKSSTCRYKIGSKNMSFAPRPFTACCTGNVNRIMPNFALSLWDMHGSTVTARMYAPCTLTGDGFAIEEVTEYPFDLKVTFRITTGKPLTLRLRIPAWSTKTTVDGKVADGSGFCTLEVTGSTTVQVEFFAEILQKENGGGVYFTRGPLVYALGMKGKRSHYDVLKTFPSYRMTPDQKWNYAIVGSGNPEFIPGKAAWDLDKEPPHITVDAREVENWRLRRMRKSKGVDEEYNPITVDFGELRTFTPLLPKTMELGKAERITLYPYGAGKLRMTVLPKTE